jgi:hypothetical protein
VALGIKLGAPPSIEAMLGDRSLLYWWNSRFAPGAPPLYRTFFEVPVQVFRESEYLDATFAVVGMKEQ